jgi:hypothetical protein
MSEEELLREINSKYGGAAAPVTVTGPGVGTLQTRSGKVLTIRMEGDQFSIVSEEDGAPPGAAPAPGAVATPPPGTAPATAPVDPAARPALVDNVRDMGTEQRTVYLDAKTGAEVPEPSRANFPVRAALEEARKNTTSLAVTDHTYRITYQNGDIEDYIFDHHKPVYNEDWQKLKGKTRAEVQALPLGRRVIPEKNPDTGERLIDTALNQEWDAETRRIEARAAANARQGGPNQEATRLVNLNQGPNGEPAGVYLIAVDDKGNLKPPVRIGDVYQALPAARDWAAVQQDAAAAGLANAQAGALTLTTPANVAHTAAQTNLLGTQAQAAAAKLPAELAEIMARTDQIGGEVALQGIKIRESLQAGWSGFQAFQDGLKTLAEGRYITPDQMRQAVIRQYEDLTGITKLRGEQAAHQRAQEQTALPAATTMRQQDITAQTTTNQQNLARSQSQATGFLDILGKGQDVASKGVFTEGATSMNLAFLDSILGKVIQTPQGGGASERFLNTFMDQMAARGASPGPFPQYGGGQMGGPGGAPGGNILAPPLSPGGPPLTDSDVLRGLVTENTTPLTPEQSDQIDAAVAAAPEDEQYDTLLSEGWGMLMTQEA